MIILILGLINSHWYLKTNHTPFPEAKLQVGRTDESTHVPSENPSLEILLPYCYDVSREKLTLLVS